MPLRIPDRNEVSLEQSRISNFACVSPQEARDSQHQVGISLRADIGVPLQSLKSLLNSNKLPNIPVEDATKKPVMMIQKASMLYALWDYFVNFKQGVEPATKA